jgi:hypothetical protein
MGILVPPKGPQTLVRLGRDHPFVVCQNHQLPQSHTQTPTQTVTDIGTDTITDTDTDTDTHRHTDTQTHRHTDTQTHRHIRHVDGSLIVNGL